MSSLLGLITLGFLAVLLMGRILTGLEIRSLDHEHRGNVRQIGELEEDLDTSRRKYLIALKAEGVAKQKLAHLRTRRTNMKQQMEQIELTMQQQEAQEHQELEHTLEVLVMKALGGPSARRDTHFKRVMKVIRGLIDVEKQGNSEELLTVVQEKLAEMGHGAMLGDEKKAGGRAKGDRAIDDEGPGPR